MVFALHDIAPTRLAATDPNPGAAAPAPMIVAGTDDPVLAARRASAQARPVTPPRPLIEVAPLNPAPPARPVPAAAPPTVETAIAREQAREAVPAEHFQRSFASFVAGPTPEVASPPMPQASGTARSYLDVVREEEEARTRPAARSRQPRPQPESPNAERGDGGSPYGQIARETLRSLNPFGRTAFEKHQALLRDPHHEWDGVRLSPMAYDAEVKDTYGIRAVHPVTGRRNVPHSGTDFRADRSGRTDSPLVAPVGGFVSLDRSARGAEGVSITLYGDDGIKYRFLHLEQGSIPRDLDGDGRNNDDRVEAGQFIGRVGGTGRVTGPHLHFETYRASRDVPLFPGDYRSVNPDSLYPENLARRGQVLRADIREPRQQGRGTLRVEVIEAHEMRERHGREPVVVAAVAASGPVNYLDTLSPQERQRLQQTQIAYAPDGALPGAPVSPGDSPAGAMPLRGPGSRQTN